MTSANAPVSDEFIAACKDVVGEKYTLTDLPETEIFATELRGRYGGHTPLVLQPSSTEEVSRIMRLCDAHGVAVVPQGGNTGLVGAQSPSADNSQIILSLSRMNAVRDIDPFGNTLIVEAGCILENLQKAADDVDRLFPLRIGSQGSCQIGGNISANAGGTGVLAYGNTRDLVLGLEVVLADGRIWHGLNRLKKNNTGYDLKHLFIAGEGTLGIITAAVLKLFPKPRGTAMGLVAVENPDMALEFFSSLQNAAGPSLTAFELIARRPFDFLYEHYADKHRDPLSAQYPWYCLVEISSQRSQADAEETLQSSLETAFENGQVVDAAIANSLAQQAEFWLMRENISWAQKNEGASIKHDISVPVAAIPAFIEEAENAVHGVEPKARIVCFGHMGDGNLHYNVSQPKEWQTQEQVQNFLALEDTIHEAVYSVVTAHKGSISAEHGIGQMKRDTLAALKAGPEMDLMHAIKHAFDPKALLNPGKLLASNRGNAT
jgi:FAD/FMN-containing dehydrogenase